MIQPLHLGNKIFPNNIIQGPLAGVSCAPFRLLTWRYSQPAFSYTEMISCKTLIYQPQHVQQLAELLGNEKFAILQARKFAKYYACNLANKTEFGTAINNIDSLRSLQAICLYFFEKNQRLLQAINNDYLVS